MKIIVIEGPDRVGKATQAKRLKEYLAHKGKRVEIVEVPIKRGVTYDAIYWMLGNGLAKKLPRLFQTLQFLNRWTFQKVELPKLASSNDFVIFDRWSLSTNVYGLAEGLGPEFVNYFYSNLRRPDYTFVLLGDSHQHEAEDVYERDTALQKRVRILYDQWAKNHPDECHVINCQNPKELITAEMVGVLRASGVLDVKDEYIFLS